MLNLYNIFLTENKKLLNENMGREMSHARKVLRSYGFSDQVAKEAVERWEAKPCFRKTNGRFMKGYARMVCDREITDGEIDKKSKMIEKIICLIYRKYKDLFTTNLESVKDGRKWSANELIEQFQEEIQQESEEDIENSANKGITKSKEYDFVRIPNFSDAREYGQYTDWCVTHGCENYNSYTDNGEGIFIFCLKHGFAQVPRQVTEDCPMDEYGKSMIAISVDGDGELNTCTCRWNHANGAGDQMMTREEIEDFFGVNFYETFYARTEDEPFENEEVDNPEYWYDRVFDDAELVTEIQGEQVYLMQSVDDCSMNGEMYPEDSPHYGLYYNDTFISDTEYYRTDIHTWGYNHVIMKRDENKSLYDLYVIGDRHETDKLKNMYAWEEVGDGSYLIGSYQYKNTWRFFSADLSEGTIWGGEDHRRNRVVTMEDPIKFVWLEDYTEELGESYENYVAIQNGNRYTIIEIGRGAIICQDAEIKFEEGCENIKDYVPTYNEQEEEYYIETVDGVKYDPVDGTVLNRKDFNHDVMSNYNLRLYKDFGNYKIFGFEERWSYPDRHEIPINIWYNGHWLFKEGQFHLSDMFDDSFTPICGTYIKYVGDRGRRFNMINLETGKFKFPEHLQSLNFNEEYQYGYGWLSRKHYIFNSNGKLILPMMTTMQEVGFDFLHVVIFENREDEIYVLSLEEYPKIVNKDRPFGFEKRLKKDEANCEIQGADKNGISIAISCNGVRELQTEQYKRQFHDKLKKLK